MKNEDIKLGCLVPLYSMVFIIILCLTIITMLNCRGSKSEREIEEDQLNEIVEYHKSQGREIIVFRQIKKESGEKG